MSDNLQAESTGGCGCSDVHVSMYALLDRELTEAECRRLEEHVRNCPHCAELMEAETQLRQLLRRCCCDQAPQSLRERVTLSIRVARTTFYRS